MRRLIAIGVAAFSLAALAGPALANDADVIRRGDCSGRSDWKLKLSPEDGRLEVEYEVDSNVVGQTWNVRLFRNGNLFFQGTRTTQAPSGSFEVDRLISNAPGADEVTARARNVATDELCRGAATF